MKFQIKSCWSSSVLFSLETDSLRLCVEAAVRSRADLSGADLRGADLSDANLRGAYLGGADLSDAYLSAADLSDADGEKIKCVGDRTLLCIGPLGSRSDYLYAWLTYAGVYVKAGCFWNTLAEFTKAVKATHGTTVHGKEYAAAIALIKAHAKLWTPKKPRLKDG